VVHSNPVAGKVDEDNKWYTEQLLDDVLKVPGFVAAQRYKFTADTGNPTHFKYLAIYEIEIDDVTKSTDGLNKARDDGSMYISPGIDIASVVATVFTPITERVTKKK
jgi:hypothetical protein